MKQTIITIMIVFLWNIAASQTQNGVGINTNSPTETLDVNGSARFRGISDTAYPQYVMGLDDSGKVFKIPYDSLQNNSGGAAELVTSSFISGDTIEKGDFVVAGDGASGIMRVNTYNFPYATIPFSNIQTLYAQTFVTTSKAIGIKAVLLNLESQSLLYTITCSIRNVTGGFPIGLDINGQNATVTDINSYQSSFARMVFDPPVPVIANTTYAVVVRVTVGVPYVFIHKQSLGMYSAGYRCTSTNGGATWTTQTNEDINCFIYETQTESGKVYRTDPALSGLIGSNTTTSCLEANGCPSTFYGQNDQRDNPIGVAMNDALPSQTVTVQMMGHTDLITGFSPGKRLYLTSPPGAVGTAGSKLVGISTGNGAVIQIDY